MKTENEYQNMQKKPYLDIIVPHAEEPWSTGRKFFDMLGCQRGINFDDISVILVNDGSDNFPESVLDYPYRIFQLHTSKRGVSYARNAGIKLSSSEWIAFCDFDDMYLSAHSIKTAMEAMRKADKENVVYLWNGFMEENDAKKTEDYKLFTHQWDATFVHGRFIKRQFIIDNSIYFDTNLSYGEDAEFNTVCQIVAGRKRMAEIKTPIYLWCDNPNSVTRRVNDKTELYSLSLKHRIATAEELQRRGIQNEYKGAVVRMVTDCYYEFTGERVNNNITDCLPQFAQFWNKHKQAFQTAPKKMFLDIMRLSRENACKSGNCVVEKITLFDWLKQIEKYSEHKNGD